MTTTLIIDDSKRDREHLLSLLNKHDDIDIVQECTSGEEGIKGIAKHRPQLIFLDVEMPGMSGFEMLEKITDRDFEVIFTTAHSKYAVQALNLTSIHYLLKIISDSELRLALDKFRQKENEKHRISQYETLLQNIKSSGNKNKKIAITSIDKHGEKIMDFYPIETIVYCNSPAKDGDGSKGAYTTFHFKDQSKTVASRSIGHYIELLADYDFFKAERGYLINMAYLKSMKDSNNPEVILEYYPSVKIPVSRRYIKLFEARLLK